MDLTDINTISPKLEEQMDTEDTEEGEILEDGEIPDEDDVGGNDPKAQDKASEEKENNRDKDCYNKDKDSRRRDSDKDRKSEDRVRDKDRDRRERDRDRRHTYDRTTDRTDRSSRERKTSEDRDRERERKTIPTEEERRRRERERKRRRSDEEDRDDRQRDEKRKRGSRDQIWSEFNTETNNNRNNNTFDEYERQRFEDFDFRQPDPHFPTSAPTHQSSDDEELSFDDRDFEEMLQIMEHNMPSNRVRAMEATEKRAMMKAMALMMKRNIDSDKGKRLARLRDKRRTNERTPGPTGTRAITRPTPPERTERQSAFKQICKFYLDGKCHKGNDCPFSHEAMPTKKRDLCKFYLQGFCGKGDDCLFMHSEFPCKFFHTNVECYSGDKCRFSHKPLTEDTREILRNYLDSGQLPDDPKPDRQFKHNDTKSDTKSDNSFKNQTNSEQTNQTLSQTTSAVQSTPTYAPLKPVAKRHAVLGDPTHEMKTSHHTWVWQQEMKELEVAYVGNKRNLFCIEKPFVLTQKPPTPRMEDDEEEIEEQIRNYYRDTIPEFAAEDQDLRTTGAVAVVTPKVEGLSDEQKLIEASAHDEDLRTLMMRPRSQTNESNDSTVTTNCEQLLTEDKSQILSTEESQMSSQLTEVPHNLPKVARDLYIRMQNKLINETKSSDLLSDSDDDDREVLTAALKNIQSKHPTSDRSKRNIDISKMLSAIRHSANTSVTQSPKQSDFWQNIMSGIHLASSAGGSPSGNSTPPRSEYRDPRLKRGKESLSPQIETTPPVKICDPNVKIEYKLWPMRALDIDYSTYVSIYRIDSRLKNDPRLQKFFSKLPNSEIDSLSRLVPPPLKTAPVTPLSVLKSKKRSEKERKDKNKDKPNADSPTLPPLPPLTISPSKCASTPGIFPPTPPPIMSPFELISSKPTFTVIADTKPLNTDILDKNTLLLNKRENNENNQRFHSNIKNTLIDDKPNDVCLESASSPDRNDTYIKEETNVKVLQIDSKPESIEQQLNSRAVYLPPISSDIKPVFYSTNSLPTLTSTSSPLPSTPTTIDVFESTFHSTPDSQTLDQKCLEGMETASNYSTEDDLYDNLYPSETDVQLDTPCPPCDDNYSKDLSQNSLTSSSVNSNEDEFELIRNELKAPVVSVDSDTEMEIDLRQRKDSVSEVESADECELMIAISSETEDNIDSDLTTNSVNNGNNVLINECNNNSNVFVDKPMDLSVISDIQTSGAVDDTQQINDLSLKSVFSTIDPTASPFC